MLSFEKPPLSIFEQISLLKSRGLVINNPKQCKTALAHIGYYRLSGYMLPFYVFPTENHVFKRGTKFEEIIEHYEFDRQLRILCINAIEKIEVSFRANVSNYMSLYDKNSHWYENEHYFKDIKYHSKLLNELRNDLGKPTDKFLRKPKEKFIDHYHSKYSYPELPPSWMIFETLSFGEISFLFKNLLDCHKKQIASSFDQDDKILSSWIHSLCFLRNLCAHHSRVWNRDMSISPKIAKRHRTIQNAGKNNSFFGLAVIIKIILDKIDPKNPWVSQLHNLIKTFPNINTVQMGFPKDGQKVFPLI